MAPKVDNLGGYYPYSVTNARRSNYLFSSFFGYEMTPFYPAPSTVTGDKTGRTGMFGTNGAAKFADVTDGLSNTLMVGESKQQVCNPYWGPHWGTGYATTVMGWVYDDRFVINYKGGRDATICSGAPADRLDSPGPWTFSSWHSGGANFVFADGSVHFVKESMSIAMLQTLASINGGEVGAGDW